jgi:hypothetical protein
LDKGYKLIDEKTGAEIEIGSSVKLFEGSTWWLKDWYTKPFPSTGRVVVFEHTLDNVREFYPSVIGAKIVPE